MCPALNCYQHFANLTTFTVCQFFEVCLKVNPRHYVILLINKILLSISNRQWFLFLTQPQYYYQCNKHDNNSLIPPNIYSMFRCPRISYGPFCFNEDPKWSIYCICVFSPFLTYDSYSNIFLY